MLIPDKLVKHIVLMQQPTMLQTQCFRLWNLQFQPTLLLMWHHLEYPSTKFCKQIWMFQCFIMFYLKLILYLIYILQEYYFDITVL